MKSVVESDSESLPVVKIDDKSQNETKSWWKYSQELFEYIKEIYIIKFLHELANNLQLLIIESIISIPLSLYLIVSNSSATVITTMIICLAIYCFIVFDLIVSLAVGEENFWALSPTFQKQFFVAKGAINVAGLFLIVMIGECQIWSEDLNQISYYDDDDYYQSNYDRYCNNASIDVVYLKCAYQGTMLLLKLASVIYNGELHDYLLQVVSFLVFVALRGVSTLLCVLSFNFFKRDTLVRSMAKPMNSSRIIRSILPRLIAGGIVYEFLLIIYFAFSLAVLFLLYLFEPKYYCNIPQRLPKDWELICKYSLLFTTKATTTDDTEKSIAESEISAETNNDLSVVEEEIKETISKQVHHWIIFLFSLCVFLPVIIACIPMMIISSWYGFPIAEYIFRPVDKDWKRLLVVRVVLILSFVYQFILFGYLWMIIPIMLVLNILEFWNYCHIKENWMRDCTLIIHHSDPLVFLMGRKDTNSSLPPSASERSYTAMTSLPPPQKQDIEVSL